MSGKCTRIEALCSRLRVLLGAHHLNAHEALIAFNPSVVARGNGVRHSRLESFLSTVVQSDRKAPGHRIADVRDLAAGCANNRLDALRPLPSRLEIQSPQCIPRKPDNFDS